MNLQDLDPVYKPLIEARILILSQDQASVFKPPENSVLIRISDPYKFFKTLSGSWQHVCKAKFYDVTSLHLSAIMAGYVVPTEKDLRPIFEFLTLHKDKFVVVHCAAGISRSAAVAKVYAEYIGRQDISEYISSCGIFDPNSEVVYLLREMWGLL